jgi:predicted O-linked N-acetylglucosamine transferase (SPINDLY family)
VSSYDAAIILKPDYAEAFYNRAIALQELKQPVAAVSSYDKAISLKPDYAEAYNNRGNALKDLNQLEAAVASYDKAISLKPDYAEAHNNRGNALAELRRLEEVLTSYEITLRLNPAYEYLLGKLLYTKLQLCDWQGVDARTAELIHKIQNKAKASVSFNVLSLSGSLSVQRKAAEIYSQDKYPAAAKPVWSGQKYEHARIRVAYVSCDFNLHPAALNNIGMWERHDRERFEVIAISYGPVYQEDATPQGQMRARLVKAFDKFLDVGGKSDEQVARLMQELEVDIAVDISGTMGDARQGILAHRPAPVQVNLCGYTLGAPYIDYIIEDRVVIPPEHEVGYTEKVVCLPYARLPNDTSREVSTRQFTRRDLELPEVGVVYCSFNNAYKFNPQMFDVWMRILQRVPGSVLWLQGGGQEKVKENLSKEASARGVDPTRLVFAHKIESMADHLARHRAADVFLDTLPFNAQTTAVDALWAGLPVLTCLGESAIGRVAGSVLMALGMSELVTKSLQEYEAQAVRIGLESGYAKSLKDKLERNRVDAPLFDTARLTRHMESAYEQMHERVQQGLGPQGFEVEANREA